MTANALTTTVQHAYEPPIRCNMLLHFYEVTPDVWCFTYRVFKMEKKKKSNSFCLHGVNPSRV